MAVSRIVVVAKIVWFEMLRRKDVYVLLILLGTLLTILVSLNIFGLGSAVGYVMDIGLLIVWLFGWILAINLSTRQLPQEEQRGTIFPLLAKPLSRWELILGKWLGAWGVALAATLGFYLLVGAVVYLKGGTFEAASFLQAFLLHGGLLGVLCALGLLLSTRLSQEAAATLSYVMSGAAFLIVPRIPELAAYAPGWRGTALLALFHAAPHLEVFDMRKRLVHDYGPVSPLFFGLVLLYGLVWIGILIVAARTAYQGKKFSRCDLH